MANDFQVNDSPGADVQEAGKRIEENLLKPATKNSNKALCKNHH